MVATEIVITEEIEVAEVDEIAIIAVQGLLEIAEVTIDMMTEGEIVIEREIILVAAEAAVVIGDQAEDRDHGLDLVKSI